MPKKSVCERNRIRKLLVDKYFPIQQELKKVMYDLTLSDKVRNEAKKKFHALPRKARPVQYRNRCTICGRPRAFNRRTGMCRFHMRMLVLNGEAPGMQKDSF